MKKVSLALFVSLLALSGTGYTASKTPAPTSEITESTDPARADEVMRKAQEMESKQQSSADMSSGSSGTSKKSKHSKSKKSSMKSKPSSGDSGSGSSGASGDSSSSPPDSGSTSK